MNAVNDALRPLGAIPITQMPITPGVVLQALGLV
jgi:aerobic carbon-monoxide dehydrogenase large subunit